MQKIKTCSFSYAYEISKEIHTKEQWKFTHKRNKYAEPGNIATFH